MTRLSEKQTRTQRYHADADAVAYYTTEVIRQLHRDIEDFIQRWYEQAYRTFSNKLGTGYAESFEYEQAMLDALDRAKWLV
jgi:predicted GNAT superfamily acetyltransferase